jgi:hypothetical protein
MRAAIWLMPEAGAQAVLDEAISTYATRHGRPAFAAHLTLIAGVASELLRDADAEELAARHAPFALEQDGWLRTETFTQSLALLFRMTPALAELRGGACEVSGGTPGGEGPPHVSLTYGAAIEVEPLMAAARRLPRRVRFDALCIARYPRAYTSQDEVAETVAGNRIILKRA